jgi:hypothetical protein
MTSRIRSNVFAGLIVCVAIASVAAPAQAQYRPLSPSGSKSTSNGERYHVEIGVNFWNPVPKFVVASESLGIPGTDIDMQADLAIQSKTMYETRITLRPAKKHKFRFQYLPMQYSGQTHLQASIIFNGILFPVDALVDTQLSWKTYRIGYEYDFIYRPQGYLGVILEAKYTDVKVQLGSVFANEYAQAKAPIPAIGLGGRINAGKYVTLTGEFTFFKLPSQINQNYQAHYFDYDFYGTVNLTNNFGAQAGYRTLDLSYSVDRDSGSGRLSGPYFGGVVRF